MAREYKNVWIRIAGNSKRIKEDLPAPHWRYEIEGQDEQYLLKSWVLQGQPTLDNNTQGTKPRVQGNEFLAWVKFYGDVVVNDEDEAVITLKPIPVI